MFMAKMPFSQGFCPDRRYDAIIFLLLLSGGPRILWFIEGLI